MFLDKVKFLNRKFDLGIFLTLLFSFVFVFPLLRPGFYTIYDDMQVARVWQMDKCFNDLQIPCRWVPDLGLGYGYPLFTYYAPLPYYIMELTHIAGLSFIDSVKAGFILSILAASLFFYKFLRLRYGIGASILGMVLFVYAPYKASDLFVRGAVGELWGMAMVALLLYTVERYFVSGGVGNKIMLTVSTFLFLIAHNLSVLIFAPFIALYIAIRFFENNYHIKDILENLTSIVIGVGLSAFYIFPMYFEKDLVHIDTLTAGYFGYLQHFLNIKQIFLSLNWGYGPSILGPGDETLLGIGPLHSILLVSAIIFVLCKSLFLTKKKLEFKAFFFPIFLLTFLALSAFLTHEKSTFIYKLVPLLQIIQFPWRFIMLSIFIIPIFVSYAANLVSRKNVVLVVILVSVLCGLIYFPMFKPKDWFSITDEEKLSGNLLKKQLTASIYDYLPIAAKKAPDNVPNSYIISNSGEFKEIITHKGTNWYQAEVEVYSEKANLSLASYNYPVWKVFVDKGEVGVGTSSDYGLVTFDVERGIHQISAKQGSTPLKTISDSISLVSLAAGFLYFGKMANKNR